MNNTFLSDFCTTYQIPKIQEKLNTLYPNFDQKIPYTWIKMARDTVYPKPLAGPDTWPSHRWPENWPVKYSMLQARKVHFPTDHLTSRNWKQSLTKYTYWHSNVFRSLQMQCHVFCTCTKIFLASKQVRKSWYSRAKKTTLILYTHAAIQVQAFWRKVKKLRLFSRNKSLML